MPRTLNFDRIVDTARINLWTTLGTRAPEHVEGGKGTKPKVYRVQFRSHPLAD